LIELNICGDACDKAEGGVNCADSCKMAVLKPIDDNECTNCQNSFFWCRFEKCKIECYKNPVDEEICGSCMGLNGCIDNFLDCLDDLTN
jgi:hypothetical protein